MTHSEAVAAELRAEAARQKLSRRAIARKLEKPATTIARWMRGETDLSIGEIDDLCTALNLDISELMLRALPRLDSNQQPAGSLLADVA